MPYVWHAIVAWIVVGLLVGLVPARPDGLRCTFLAVGHGGAILVETPNGRTLLYDAGSIHDGDRAARTIQAALWHRRHARIDAIVLSHPDVDHFNAVPELIRTVPVGAIFVERSFFDFDQPSVVELCDAARNEGVPIRVIQEGDRLAIDESVSVRVLHPPTGERWDLDNANSVILLIEYAGRSILLTGDLEREGLSRFLMSPPRNVNVLLAPHHGSPNASPPALAAWARPRYVVASSGRNQHLPHLHEVYGETARVYMTAASGAVTFEIDPMGNVRVTEGREAAAALKAVLDGTDDEQGQ